ncbi:hypothetical protein QC761_0112740 [Podospora bellae-mahoneyi]|uniref:Uncharacterized protein n=1 Tax=Podospora bellae-mahoneyi TaxID=2093777 RepID=A0ABR0F9X7_9PEZI|nr:hypothetical protein QC761_0112740 [Podospora bellae-mahoneyi]
MSGTGGATFVDGRSPQAWKLEKARLDKALTDAQRTLDGRKRSDPEGKDPRTANAVALAQYAVDVANIHVAQYHIRVAFASGDVDDKKKKSLLEQLAELETELQELAQGKAKKAANGQN